MGGGGNDPLVIGQHYYAAGGTAGHYWWGWGNSYRRTFQSTDRTPASALSAAVPTLLWNTSPGISGLLVNSSGGAVVQGTMIAPAVAGPGSEPFVLVGQMAFSGLGGAVMHGP